MTAGIAVAEHWPASKTTSNEKEMIQPSEFGASLSTRYWPVILRYSERGPQARACRIRNEKRACVRRTALLG